MPTKPAKKAPKPAETAPETAKTAQIAPKTVKIVFLRPHPLYGYGAGAVGELTPAQAADLIASEHARPA